MANVLVVEDDPTVSEEVVSYLERAGHTPRSVADGAPGGVTSDTRDGRADIDLVILDLMLTGLDGVEVCRQLRRVNTELAVIVLTALGEENDRIAGLEVGADDYITKAFSPREPVLRVDSLLRRARVALGPEQVFGIGGITVDTVWGVGYRMGEPRGER